MLPTKVPVELEDNIPNFVKENIPSITDDAFVKWKKSSSNSFEDIFKTIK
jgi:hypothetical protein